MVKTLIKIAIIGSVLLALLATIPDLFTPLAIMIDTVFDLDFVSLMNNVYSVIPGELMAIFTTFFGVLAIGILISWLTGGKSKQ